MQQERRALVADQSLVGRALCVAHADRADAFLAGLLDAATDGVGGVSLVALGGYGRRELSLQSDLDVLLLHDGRGDVAPVADAVWYPVWDAGVKLGHAVRTPKEALAIVGTDLDSATATLQGRHVAGDETITADVLERTRELWARRARRFLPQMSARVVERHRRAGEVAFLLEPDLKEGRGGLRDVQSLDWAVAAGGERRDADQAALRAAYDVLLDVRVELHRGTGRIGDVLALQEQDGVAASLGYGSADELMRAVATAGRTIAYRSDEAWRRIDSSLRRSRGRLPRRDRILSDGIVLRGEEIHLADDAEPATDPLLVLRAANHAVDERAPIHPSALNALGAAPPLPTPWPAQARDAFVALLSAGRDAIGPWEALDQHGLTDDLLPEWASVRSKPQRNAYHTFTVDRHLVEAAANAAGLADRVARVDLLVVGALLHDIGKGRPGDHIQVGMEMVDAIGRRMGFDGDDVATLVALVEHHLLLPDVATRRDLADPEVVDKVAAAIGSLQRLELLHTLTEADSLATGPAAWGPWKAALVATLVERVHHVLEGGEVGELTASFPSDAQRAEMARGERIVRGFADSLTVVDDDRPGLFSRVAGAVTLHGLRVLEADIATIEGRAIEVLTVEARRGRAIDWPAVAADVERALDGRLALRARLSERAATYRTAMPPLTVDPEVEFHLDDSSHATVVEVHAPDAVGVLYRITAAIADFDLDIVRARVQTLLDEVVDTFYVQDANGDKVPEETLPELRKAILHAAAP